MGEPINADGTPHVAWTPAVGDTVLYGRPGITLRPFGRVLLVDGTRVKVQWPGGVDWREVHELEHHPMPSDRTIQALAEQMTIDPAVGPDYTGGAFTEAVQAKQHTCMRMDGEHATHGYARYGQDSLEILISRWSDASNRAANSPDNTDLREVADEAKHALEVRLAALRGFAKALNNGYLLEYLDGVTPERQAQRDRAMDRTSPPPTYIA